MDVSLVVPVLNRKEYIEKTIDSIVSSRVAFQEIILVDNGSTDGTYELVQTFPRRYSIPIIVIREEKAGAPAARNRGLLQSSCKWVCFFDSDDEFTGFPDSWDDDADLVCFPTVMVAGSKEKVRDFTPVANPYVHILNSMLNTQGMVFRTAFLKSIVGWNENCLVWNDWELGLRALISSNKTQWLTDRAYHRILIHPDSLTGVGFSGNFEKICRTLAVAVEDTMHIEDDKERNRCLLALFYRVCILAGNLHREGNFNASESLAEDFTYVHPSQNLHLHAGRVLKWYTGIGGRGSWRIALFLVKLLK